MSDSNLLRDKLRSHLAKERDFMGGQMFDGGISYEFA